MQNKVLVVLGITVALVVVLAASGVGAHPTEGPSAQGGAPTLISYQGRLTDPITGQPKPDGNYDMTFRIYPTPTGGSPVWSENQQVLVSGGLFNVLLGSVNPLAPFVFDGTDRWLEVKVGPEVLIPRQRVVSVAYAIQAQEAANADTLDGLESSDLQRRVSGTCASGNAIQVINADGTVTCQAVAVDPHDHWGESWSGSGIGLTLTSSDEDGLRVSAGDNGIHVESATDNGVHVQSAGLDGVRVDSADHHGVYANTTATYGFYTPDKIYAGDGYVDIAEHIDAASDVERGDVVVIDPGNNERVVKSTKPYDTSVAGIISTDPALLIGRSDTKTPLALAGQVPCKVSGENGPIHRGDLLTTSSIPGHAMKAAEPKLGTILGKALGELESGTGVIYVLVTLQ